LGFGDVEQLIDVDLHEVVGYRADAYLDGRKVGQRLMPLNVFTSKQAFQGFALANGGASVQITDAMVTGMAEIFRRKAMTTGRKIHLVGREGLDYIRQSDGSVHAVYVSHEEEFVHAPNGDKKIYSLRTAGRDTSPIESDLMHAPALADTPEMRHFLNRLFRINKRDTVAKLLGWFTACFYSQAIRLRRAQFPLLHVYGTAGAGKTKTCQLLSHLHYYLKPPEISMATTLTGFAMKTRLASSASIPLIWDEVKFHEMNIHTKNMITQYLRNNYVAAKSEAGQLRKETGQSYVDLRSYVNGAPLAFIGETMETESAIMERYVAIGRTKQDRGAKLDFDACFSERERLGSVGKAIVAEALVVDLAEMYDKLAAYELAVQEVMPGNSSDESRRVFNYAVTLLGLEKFGDTLSTVFGDAYKVMVEDLKTAVLATVAGDLPKNMSESSKVLDTLAFLTKAETDDQYRLLYGTDYTVAGKYVDLKLQNCFNKYLKHCRNLGLSPLFPEYGRFVAGMKKYPATVDTMCINNENLKDTARVDVFRFDLEILSDEGVDSFRH
jgi:hypothetical protein